MMKKPALLRHVLIIGTSVLTGYLLLASCVEWSEMEYKIVKCDKKNVDTFEVIRKM